MERWAMVQFRRGGTVEDSRIPQVDTGRMETGSRRADMNQMAAISAFEGMRPKPDFALLRDRYASGEISAAEFRSQVLGRWKKKSS
ncbi:antitoxin VbhA family protein [Azospirillum sp. M2T2B2]|uniref:Antitoxin VbhA domain-containing protein n=1 Tax=Azospirillum ramasamyi TaxID=682998 RepID=A0A2U9S7X6_9PROT|nr:hypothetical protein DM194_15090 [Azospirillum ramasamyi]